MPDTGPHDNKKTPGGGDGNTPQGGGGGGDRPGSGGEGGGKNGGSGGPPQPPNNNLKFTRGLMMWMMLLMLAFVVFVLFNSQDRAQTITLAQLTTLYKTGHVEADSVVIRSGSITAKVKEETPSGISGPIKVKIGPSGHEYYIERVSELTNGNYTDETAQNVWWQVVLTLLPWILIIFVIWFFFFRSIRNAGGGAGMFGNFGRSKHRVTNKEHTNITFHDVAGIDEAKEELEEIVQFLKNPKRFQRLGGRIPRGVLLNGPPGCGKTLLAKAIAGEAEVPFFSISGSDFVEMFVGVGASRVRDLFKQAKENSPCIIFLDEIDAVGRKRGGGFVTGGNDEREQTLNAILVEMDGFESNDQVIVIAATNRDDVLDPALTRPGRFDRQVVVPLPDLEGRKEILKVHARTIKLSPQADLDRLARGTPMFSGADLAAIINESAIIATLAGKEFVEQDDLEEARDKIKFGRARRSHVMEEKEKIATAYHEAGHAVVQALQPDADPLHKVTIIPRGQYGGATFSLPEKDRYGYGKKYLDATMRVLCAGRIAEERASGDISSGAAQDIRQVTAFARMMVLEWGMSDRLGFVRYGHEDSGPEAMWGERSYSDETAQIIDEEIKRIADEAFEDCQRVLNENWEKVEAVAEALIKYETLSAEEVHRLMRGDTLDKKTVAGLLEAERRKAQAAQARGEEAASSSSGDSSTGEEPDSGGMMPAPA